MGPEAKRSVFSDHQSPETSFPDHVAWLLDRMDCRRADTDEQREPIYRLRYQAYMREGTITPNATETFSDPYDSVGDVYHFGLYIDGELSSALRIHVISRDNPISPSFEVFSDVLQPEVDAGKVIIDTTRFVTDEKFSKLYRGLPYATLRPSWLAGRYFGADHSLAAVRAEHQSFYRRVFNHRLIAPPRPYPHLAKPICLMTIQYQTAAEQVQRRYPFFRSTLFERRMLFERPVTAAPIVPSDAVVMAG